MGVTEQDRYLFDLNGYLVVRGALDAAELADLNDLVEANSTRPSAEATRSGLAGMFEWGKPFLDLVDHPSVLPYLLEWVDNRLRLDICYGQCSAQGDVGLDLHLGNTPFLPPADYHFRDGRPRCGLTVVSWALTDAPEGSGGFTCIPGSHKANYRCPDDIVDMSSNPGCRVPVPVRAGDAVIFTEALTHGTLPWTAASERRVLFYRYTPGHVVFEAVPWPDAVLSAATPRQQLLLEPAYTRTAMVDEHGRTGQKGREPITEG